MSTNQHVYGIIKPDEKHKKIMAVVKSCYDAEIELPREVNNYFRNSDLFECSAEYILEEAKYGILKDIPQDAIENYSADMCEGIDVDLEKLPSGIHKIRFYTSY